MATAIFNIHGMSCSGCANSIQRRLQSTPGVTSTDVNLAGGMATVEYDDALTNQNSLEKVIEDLGYDVVYGMGREA